MDDGLVILRLHGLDARNGRVPTEAFTGLIRRFAATMAIFERAFTGRRNRTTDLNVATLGRENPLVIGLRPETRARGYSPLPAVLWTFDELDRIGRGEQPDPRVPIEALENLVELSDSADGDRKALAGFSAAFNGHQVRFDDAMARTAKTCRKDALARLPAPTWFSGVSKGELRGELRGVTDLYGEREFYVRVLTTQRGVKCIFPEALRTEMNKLLFQPVRIWGFLHYDGSGPHASMVEAIEISGLHEAEKPHMFDRRGMFRDSHYPYVADITQ